MQHSRIRVHFASTAEDTRESGSTVSGIVAGVVISLLVIITATLGIIALIWLLRRCTRMHWECLYILVNHHVCVLCRKKATIKDLFPTGHFKVAHKQGASPHAQDISLDQLSSEPRLCVRQLRLSVTLSSVLNSWRESGRTRAIH